jgi:hypothetical protein
MAKLPSAFIDQQTFVVYLECGVGWGFRYQPFSKKISSFFFLSKHTPFLLVLVGKGQIEFLTHSLVEIMPHLK